MPVLTEKRFNENLSLARNSITTVKAIVQDLLIYACYKAFKDGNTTPLNAILDMAVNSKAIDQKRITRWVELHAGIARIKDEKFVLNKKVREDIAITSEESFEQVEKHLRAVTWYDIEGKAKPKSVWDMEDYLGNVIKTIEKHRADQNAPTEVMDAVTKELAAFKGKLAQMSITE